MVDPILFGCVEQMHVCVEEMHIISNYIYICIYDDDDDDDDDDDGDDRDGWIGWILDGTYACLMFFLGGLGWVHGFWMT